MGFSVTVWWGVLSVEGRKLDRCSKVIIGFPVSIPRALVKRRGPEPPSALVELIQKVSTTCTTTGLEPWANSGSF